MKVVLCNSGLARFGLPRLRAIFLLGLPLVALGAGVITAAPANPAPQDAAKLRDRLQRAARQNKPFQITPRLGVGPIRFGMSAAEVRKAIGEPYRISGSAYEYQPLGLAVMLGRDQKVVAIFAGAWCESSDILLDVFKGATREGVKLRSTPSQVIAAYGKPDSTDTTEANGHTFEVLRYEALRAQFAFRKGKLVHITLRRPPAGSTRVGRGQCAAVSVEEATCPVAAELHDTCAVRRREANSAS